MADSNFRTSSLSGALRLFRRATGHSFRPTYALSHHELSIIDAVTMRKPLRLCRFRFFKLFRFKNPFAPLRGNFAIEFAFSLHGRGELRTGQFIELTHDISSPHRPQLLSDLCPEPSRAINR